MQKLNAYKKNRTSSHLPRTNSWYTRDIRKLTEGGTLDL